ncbi:MAG TPA: sulfotransferase [Steroidobacteraceae bacterium]|nr:sulfotransferase [Steroidobacteraceae bacterium]
MGLKIVGTGLGRTGTKSMQTALKMLGFGPCHHMLEVFQHPQSMEQWIDAGEERADWDAIFNDYNSAVDYPSAAYWRELIGHYPNAKVLLTVRDPDEWFDSVQATILAPRGDAVDRSAQRLRCPERAEVGSASDAACSPDLAHVKGIGREKPPSNR